MWSRSYRKHVIMAFPSFDTATNSWAPQADISWPTGIQRESEFVRFPIRVMSEAEAVACALSRSKSWIDHRLKNEHGVAGSDSNLVLRRIRALHLPADSGERSKTRVHPGAPHSLTYRQFKSFMAELGFELSDPLLRKSYNALTKLRKSNQRSWAEIIEKFQRSPESLLQSQRARRNLPSPPLTERAWRRLIA